MIHYFRIPLVRAKTIISEVNSLRDLVNEFSKFYRLPTVKVKPGDLNGLLEEVRGLYSMSYPEIEFDSSELDPHLPLVALDSQRRRARKSGRQGLAFNG